MKKISLILSILVLTSASAFANSVDNTVESHLSNIRDRVRQCSLLPYTMKENVKVYHPLVSHCPEIKVLTKGLAKIKVGGHIFAARLIETEDTDGDFYDVQIRDFRSNDTYLLHNVLAYGDVLLGILDADTRKIPEVFVDDPSYLGEFESMNF